MSFVLFADSCSDLTREYFDQRNIRFMPLKYIIKEDMYPDDFRSDADYKEFYERIRAGAMPSTTQVTVDQFVEYFERDLKAGNDVLCITLSSGLSGTYDSSCLAVERLRELYPERTIRTVDSLSATLGEGMLVHLAANMRDDGCSCGEVADWLEQTAGRVVHWFTVDDLNHLKRGGRVSGPAALMGTIIGIKPVLNVNETGHLIPIEKHRGRKKALVALVDHMADSCEDVKTTPIMLSHGDDREAADFVCSLIKERFGRDVDRVGFIGPVIGAHAGPGAIALFFLGRRDKI